MSFYVFLINYRNNLLLKTTVNDFKKDIDVEMYMVVLINLIEHIEMPEQRILLEGILKIHNRFCLKQECICSQLIKDTTKDDEL